MNIRNIITVIVVTVLALATVAVPLQAPAAQAAPQGLKSVSFAQLLSGNYNTTRAGLSKSSAPYVTADCYLVVSGMSVNTATVKLQHSGDGTNWFDLVSFTAATTNTTAFTRTNIYGSYLRAYATLANTSTVNLNASCVMKD